MVAKAWKLIGIIENDETSCSTFYPASFTSVGDSYLKLMPNVELLEEQVILKDDEITEIIHEERRIKEVEKKRKAKAGNEKRLSVIKQEDVNEDDEDLNL